MTKWSEKALSSTMADADSFNTIVGGNSRRVAKTTVADSLSVLADGTTARRDLSARFAERVNLLDYDGASVDGVEGSIGTTDASTTATATTGVFASTDAGKHISIEAVGAGVTVTNAESDGGLIRITAANHTFFNARPFDDQRVTIKGVAGTTEANGNFQVVIPRYLITGAADNGAGLIRLTLADDVFVTGDPATVTDIIGTTEANGDFTLTRIDATHVDLQGSTFTNTFEDYGFIRFKDKFNLASSVFANAYSSGGTAHGPLSTTIATFISTTQVTLTVAPSATAAAQDFFFGTDNTVFFQAAMDAAAASGTGGDPGGGFVDVPAGICVHGKITHKKKVIVRGQGLHTTVFKAIGGLDDHLFISENFDILTGTDKALTTEGVPTFMGFQDCQIDGSKIFQRALGDGIRFYAKGLYFERFIVRKCKGNGIYTEAGVTVGQPSWLDWPQGHTSAIDSAQNGLHGWHNRGPHDQYIESAVCHLNGQDGARLETLSGSYLSTVDFSFIQCYSNSGRALYGIRTSFRAAIARLENSGLQGFYLKDCDNCAVGILHLFDNAKVGGDYQGVVDADSNFNNISTLNLRRQGRVAAGGLQLAGGNNVVAGTLQGGVTGGGFSTGVGLDLPSGAQHNNLDVIIVDYSGVGAIGLRTANGGAANFNNVTANVRSCSTLWENGTSSVGEHYRITGSAIVGATLFTGSGPSTAISSKGSWDVTLREATPTVALSKSEASTSVDLNITTEQTDAVAHNLLVAPQVDDIVLSLHSPTLNTTKVVQYMEVASVDATNVNVRFKLSTAAGAAISGNLIVRAQL